MAKDRTWLVQYQLLHNGAWWTYAGQPIKNANVGVHMQDLVNDPSIQNIRVVEYTGQPIEDVVDVVNAPRITT